MGGHAHTRTRTHTHTHTPASPASQALRKRHWDTLSAEIKAGGDDSFKLVPDELLTFQQLLDIDIMQHWDTIELVAMKANKEYKLETQLETMKNDWSPYDLIIKDHRDSGTYIIGITEEVAMLLDEHIVKTQSMLGSPYIKPFKRVAQKWEAKLQYMQNTLDEWLLVQRTWMYLEPIFSSEDILRQMPTEGRRFNNVDRMWRRLMDEAKESPGVAANGSKDMLLDKLKEANRQLELIEKGLSEYLELKRLVFPRFYFLSNEELLEILSQTKDPLAVQPHLGKCFEGINKGVFTGQGTDDLCFKSMQGYIFALKRRCILK